MQDNRFDLFLSYSRKDESKVLPLYERLIERGVRLFLDSKSLAPGDYFEDRIFADIDRSRAYGLVLTRNSLASDWVHREYLHAKRRFDAQKIRLLPLQFEQDALPAEAIQQHNVLQFWKADGFAANLQRLIFPGITARRVEVFFIAGGSDHAFERLGAHLRQVHGVDTVTIDDLYRSRRIEKALLGADGLPSRGVVVLDLFPGWPELLPGEEEIEERINFIFRLREKTRDHGNPFVFVLLQSSQAMNHFKDEVVSACGREGWERLRHYFRLHSDLAAERFSEAVDAAWTKIMRELLEAEHESLT